VRSLHPDRSDIETDMELLVVTITILKTIIITVVPEKDFPK